LSCHHFSATETRSGKELSTGLRCLLKQPIAIPSEAELELVVEGDILAEQAVTLSIIGGPQSSLSDEDCRLLRGLRAGIEPAYEELISRYQQPVYSVVYRLLGDQSDASDVVQEVFLKVFRSVNSFRERSSLRTWIYRIAVNEAHNHRRWFCRHKKREVAIGHEDNEHRTYDIAPDPGPSPFDRALDRETHMLIEQALDEISPVFRTAVILRDIEGLGYEEIADILQISLGTVKSRILRGREALRRVLSQRLEPGLAAAFI
jgi:RNA polymerase sigma-70 factor, ECF subfamily